MYGAAWKEHRTEGLIRLALGAAVGSGAYTGRPMAIGPRRIHALPEVVVNQIAAGELVERPAAFHPGHTGCIESIVSYAIDAHERCRTNCE